VTWLNREAEFNATEEDRKNYLKWWTAVANHLKDKNYLLSFNLFTEVTMKRCTRKDDCPESIYADLSKYNLWTKDVVKEIRDTKGNNAKRILFLSSPNMTADGLKSIDESIYRNDQYMMAEFHFYAAGRPDPVSRNRKSSLSRKSTGMALVRVNSNLLVSRDGSKSTTHSMV
jgi:hypothetical protein